MVWCPAATQDFNQLPQSVPTAAVVAAWWWIGLLIHIIGMLSLTMVMFEMDVRTMQCGSTVSITAQRYGLTPKSNPRFQLHSQILVIMCSGNCMTMDTSVYPHHMNAAKLFTYVICTFRNHSRSIYSLNHCTMALWCPAVTQTQDSNQLPQSVPTAAVVAAWWWIFLPIHIIWIMSLTIVMFEMMWEPCHECLQPESQVDGMVRWLESYQDFSCIIKSWSSNAVVKALWWLHLSIHTIWMPWNNIFMSYVLLGTILQVSLQPQPLHNGMVWCPAVTRDFNQLPQSVPTAAVLSAWRWIGLPSTS